MDNAKFARSYIRSGLRRGLNIEYPQHCQASGMSEALLALTVTAHCCSSHMQKQTACALYILLRLLLPGVWPFTERCVASCAAATCVTI